MTGPLTQEEVAAFTREKADYYWTRWAPLLQGQNWSAFHWPAFFFTGIWLAYRKLYGMALLFYAVFMASIAAAHVSEQSADQVGRTIGWLASIICGAGANRWYWAHAAEFIEKVRAQQLGDEKSMALLSKRGGTSIISALAFCGLLLLGSVAILRTR